MSAGCTPGREEMGPHEGVPKSDSAMRAVLYLKMPCGLVSGQGGPWDMKPGAGGGRARSAEGGLWEG